MKNLALVILTLILGSCCGEDEKPGKINPRVVESNITDMKVVYQDFAVEIRTYKLDGHDRVLVRTAYGVDDDHSENCKKCYEDPCN